MSSSMEGICQQVLHAPGNGPEHKVHTPLAPPCMHARTTPVIPLEAGSGWPIQSGVPEERRLRADAAQPSAFLTLGCIDVAFD